jgi:23S rRNA (cytidine1920-2'-O)/16S rRNA (cytidine1409-2'-O)-methyltransferase
LLEDQDGRFDGTVFDMTVLQRAERLDLALVARGLAPTRSRARDLIVRGLVSVRGQTEVRPAAMVAGDADVVVSGGDAFKVSRGGLKLEAALAAFAFSARARISLDVGASTGGFTEVLLAAGATKVYAVDVGHGQLHASLRADRRVVSLEGLDARALDRAIIPDPIGCIVADVSFISLRKALPAALDLALPGTWLVALVKPQFEVGPGGVGKGGIVRDAILRDRAYDDVSAWLTARGGWRLRDRVVSPVLGGSGNEEFLLGAQLT